MSGCYRQNSISPQVCGYSRSMEQLNKQATMTKSQSKSFTDKGAQHLWLLVYYLVSCCKFRTVLHFKLRLPFALN
jgi:hypothetical protein